jgi:hypothetical protein
LTALLTALLVKNMLVTLGALVVLAGVVVAAYFLFLE